MDTIATVRTVRRRRVPVVHVRGDLDLSAVAVLREELLALSTAGCVHLVVDLSEVTFIDSTGLGVLVAARTHLAEHGGSLALVVTGAGLLRTFRISSLVRLLSVHATVADALASVRPASPVAAGAAAVSASRATPTSPRGRRDSALAAPGPARSRSRQRQ